MDCLEGKYPNPTYLPLHHRPGGRQRSGSDVRAKNKEFFGRFIGRRFDHPDKAGPRGQRLRATRPAGARERPGCADPKGRELIQELLKTGGI